MSPTRAILIACCAVLFAAGVDVPMPAIAAMSPRVTVKNWYWAPYNRWSWQHTRRIFPSANIGRGNGPIAPLPQARRDLSGISFFDPVSKRRMTIREMLARTDTDGFMVLQGGKIVSEQYFNGMTPNTQHLLMSMTKSVVGTLAGIMVSKGKLRPDALVVDYLPQLKGTVYGRATVREVLDMTVSAQIDPSNPYFGDDQAADWIPPGPDAAPGLRAFLLTMKKKSGPDGRKFLYLDPSPLVISWIIERMTDTDFSASLQQNIWSKLGAQEDSYVLLDGYQEAYTTPGLNMTLRDLARFGQMMAQDGWYNGQQIVPRHWVEDIRAGGSQSAWQAARDSEDESLPGYEHGSYRSFWWVAQKSCGRFAAIGLGGQLLIVDPVANMVVAKFTSAPSPEAGDSGIRTAFYGADAIIRALSGHGC
jgi:CubicO group peptidase (beta-lactamase class C family)